MKSESSDEVWIYGFRDKNLDGSLILCSSSKMWEADSHLWRQWALQPLFLRCIYNARYVLQVTSFMFVRVKPEPGTSPMLSKIYWLSYNSSLYFNCFLCEHSLKSLLMVALNAHCSLGWRGIYNFPSSASQIAAITDRHHHRASLYCELFIM